MIHVAGDGEHLVGLSVKMPVPCQHGYFLPLSDSWLSYAENVFIHDKTAQTVLGTSADRESRAGSVGVYLHFTTPGLLEGRVHVHIPFRSRRVGLCTGTLKFTATN